MVTADLDIQPYRQRVLFLIASPEEGLAHLREVLADAKLTIPGKISEPSVNASAFSIEQEGSGARVFVVWMKEWHHNPDSIGRLSHETVHCAIQLLNYIGYSPRMKPAMSEPLCYLQDTILRSCLEAIMAKFGGKKAAPFKKGGGRDTSHPRTAKGTPRKTKKR